MAEHVRGAERHLFDFESLAKGDVIPPEQLERITGMKRGTPEFAFKLLNLRQRIMDEKRAMKEPVTVVCRNDSLEILTDAEATLHNNTSCNHARKRLVRGFVRLREVDSQKLSDDDKALHEQRVNVQSRYVAAVQEVSRVIRLEAVRRTVPGIIRQ